MAQAGKKVLLIDGDMQLNLSLAFFPENWVLEQAKGEKNLRFLIQPCIQPAFADAFFQPLERFFLFLVGQVGQHLHRQTLSLIHISL